MLKEFLKDTYRLSKLNAALKTFIIVPGMTLTALKYGMVTGLITTSAVLTGLFVILPVLNVGYYYLPTKLQVFSLKSQKRTKAKLLEIALKEKALNKADEINSPLTVASPRNLEKKSTQINPSNQEMIPNFQLQPPKRFIKKLQ